MSLVSHFIALRSRSVHRAVLGLTVVLALGVSDAFAQKKAPQTFNVLPLTITSVTVQGGQLVANGTLGGTPLEPLPLVLTPGAIPAGATCPILDLRLGPINLSLLGLNVDTSPICLEITALENGGLLGSLLCDIANLLNSGVPLATILGNMSVVELGNLDRLLTSFLNQALAPITSSDALVAASCNVLNLALGPLDLTILGLNVRLDDCSDGPVTVDITATPGGGLLGDLLCDLGDLLNVRHPNTTAILTVLRQVAKVIGQLIG